MERRKKMKRLKSTIAVICVVVAMPFSLPAGTFAKCEKLVAIWHAGTCPEAFFNIAKDYTKMTGIKRLG